VDQFTIIIPTRNRPEIAHELVLYIREELGWSMPIVIADQSEDGGERLRGYSVAPRLWSMCTIPEWVLLTRETKTPCEPGLRG